MAVVRPGDQLNDYSVSGYTVAEVDEGIIMLRRANPNLRLTFGKPYSHNGFISADGYATPLQGVAL